MLVATLPARRSRLTFGAILGLLVLSAGSVSAQDEPEAKQRLELMQSALGNLEVKSEESMPKAALTFASKPLLRYSDPTRGGVGNVPTANILLDAGVWRLGTEGRPTALVTVEIYQGPDRSRVVSFEFLSFTESKFSLKHKTENVYWNATASALNLKELPDAPKPAAAAAARLTQMRQLVRRFAAKETYRNQPIECRLLAQPIDRYESTANKIADGAIFAFANGTNPELGVVFESDGERWRYGVVRLSGAEASVTLDGREVAAFKEFGIRGPKDGPYNNGMYKIPVGK
jgi:hypothetical protein